MSIADATNVVRSPTRVGQRVGGIEIQMDEEPTAYHKIRRMAERNIASGTIRKNAYSLLPTNSELESQWNSLRTSAGGALSRNLCDLCSPERRWSIAVTTNFFEPKDSLFHSLKERSEIYPFRVRVFPGLYGYPTLDYMYVYIFR